MEISDADTIDDGAIEGELTPDSTGDVDLLIERPNEWYLLIELKFSAPEGALSTPKASQTEFYAHADTVDGSATSKYDSGGYYLYLPEGDPATSHQFGNWTWQDFIDDVVSEFVERASQNSLHHWNVECHLEHPVLGRLGEVERNQEHARHSGALLADRPDAGPVHTKRHGRDPYHNDADGPSD